MRTQTSDALVVHHKVSDAAAGPDNSDRLPLRQALPLWLAMAVGGWLIVGLLFEVLVN